MKIAPNDDLGTALPPPPSASVWNNGWRAVRAEPKAKAGRHRTIPKTKARRVTDDTDAGILPATRTARGSTPQGLDGHDDGTRALQDTPDLGIFNTFCEDHVDCEDGFEVGTNDTVTCQYACDGECCVDPTGGDACDKFTGKVCKDGISCTGNQACHNADIPYVFQSCAPTDDYNATTPVQEESGRYSCRGTGVDGSVGPLVLNSCRGGYSCGNLATYGDSVGNIQDSCRGEASCYSAGYYSGGGVGCIIDSCTEPYSCYYLGSTYEGGNAIDSSVIGCCNEVGQCRGYAPRVVNSVAQLVSEGGCTAPITDCPITLPPPPAPTSQPSVQPSQSPSENPPAAPSVQPSVQPSTQSSYLPSENPSVAPSTRPSQSVGGSKSAKSGSKSAKSSDGGSAKSSKSELIGDWSKSSKSKSAKSVEIVEALPAGAEWVCGWQANDAALSFVKDLLAFIPPDGDFEFP